MQLLATINDSKQWQQVLASCRLEQLSKAESLNDYFEALSGPEAFCIIEPVTLEVLIELLTQQNACLVLAFDTPEYAIGAMIEQGESINDALAIWQQQTHAILQLQQQHRRQLQLVQTEGLLINPTAAPEWLAIGHSLEQTKEASVFSHNIHHLMAAQALRQERDAERCLQRLIACSLPLLERPEARFNLDDVLQKYVLNKDQKLTASNDDNALLKNQLFHVQEELEQLLKTNNTLGQQKTALEQDYQQKVSELFAKSKQNEQAASKAQKEVNTLKTQLEVAVQDTTKTQQTLKSSTDENGLLQAQLFTVQEELEKTAHVNQTLSGQITESNDENELLLKQLFYVQEELEKVLLEGNTLTQQHKVLEQDCSSMKQKLAYVQKEFERVLQKNLRLTAENTEAQVELEQQRLQYHKLEALHQQQKELEQERKAQLELALEQVIAENVISKHQLASIQAKVDSVSSSKLWKSTASVRKLVKGITKRNRVRELLKQDITLIMGSEYFDEIWYLRNYPDVVESGVNPAEHYLLFGAAEGRAPGPMFDGHWYLSEYPDVAESNTNPLLHYVMFGAQEGRTATPKLLPYLSEHQDIKVGE